MKRPALCSVLGGLGLLALSCQGDATVRNGAMEGEPTDHSGGKGLLVTPPGWLPVNTKPERGDRLSVERSDREGAGQCLHIKTFAGDAGVYQTLAPLAKGTTYLVSAWVKRLSGELGVVAYPHAWGPRLMGVADGVSNGWTRIDVGMTPVDGGAHLYLAASGKADFLIDDVQIRRAPVKVGDPVLLPYGLSDSWRYRAQIESQDGATRDVRVQPVSGALEGGGLAAEQTVGVGPGSPAAVEFRVPYAPVSSQFSLRLSDPETGETLGGSALVEQLPTPWDVRYPYKRSLFASLGHRWPLRVLLRGVPRELTESLAATARVIDSSGRVVLTSASRFVGGALRMPIGGDELTPGEYRLSLVVKDRAGEVRHEGVRPLRVLPPAEHEVVCDPEGHVLVDGAPFFPIGMYWVFADAEDWKPGPGRKDDELRQMRDCGLNVLHSYAFEHSDATDTDENALAYLDTAHEFGLRVMMGIRRDWYQGDRVDLARIEQRVRALKGHPALLCWTLWDEPNFRTEFSRPRVKAMYDLIDRVDPYHPAMPVFGNPDGGAFRDCSDVFLFCAYPGPGAPGRVTALMNSAHKVAPELPIWYVARAYQWSPGHLPPEDEMRQYWRNALDGDARGIFWYSYGGSRTGWDSVRATSEHWEEFKRANRGLAGEVAHQIERRGD